MPVGLLVTVPLPVPALFTVTVEVSRLNVAVTVCAADIVTVQLPRPLHAPLHPVKAEPTAELAVRVTIVPLEYEEEQVAPQLTPAGLLVTVPAPVPALLTVRE